MVGGCEWCERWVGVSGGSGGWAREHLQVLLVCDAIRYKFSKYLKIALSGRFCALTRCPIKFLVSKIRLNPSRYL